MAERPTRDKIVSELMELLETKIREQPIRFSGRNLKSQAAVEAEQILPKQPDEEQQRELTEAKEQTEKGLHAWLDVIEAQHSRND